MLHAHSKAPGKRHSGRFTGFEIGCQTVTVKHETVEKMWPREVTQVSQIRIHSRQRVDDWTSETLTSKCVKIYGCMTRTSLFHSPTALLQRRAVPRENVDNVHKQNANMTGIWSLQAHICTSKPNAFHIKWNLGRVANQKSSWMEYVVNLMFLWELLRVFAWIN